MQPTGEVPLGVVVADLQLTVVQTYLDRGAVQHFPAQQGASHARFYLTGDEAAQRTGSIHGVEPLLGDELRRVVRHVQLDVPVRQPSP